MATASCSRKRSIHAPAAYQALTAYLQDIIERKRRRPDGSIISQLIAAEEAGDRLTAVEMVATCSLLLNAGHLTTTSLLGTGLWLLLTHPDQLEKLRADRSLMENAIEEMLRHDSPVQFVPRFALEELEFFGRKIRKNPSTTDIASDTTAGACSTVKRLSHAMASSAVVRDFCGHGIGRQFHCEPQVPHYGRRGTGDEMLPGMTFTIEPMINAGKRHVKLLGDAWTVVTKDHSPSAQWEHTILVTEDGHEVLTQCEGDEI